MAKASELPALNAAAATADQHIVLDVSDTTQGSGGSLKRQPANYLAKTAGDETIITGGGVIALGGHTLTVSDDGTASLSGHEHSASAITSGALDDARIAESNVTQHQAALSVTLSQVSDYTPPAVDALTDVSIDTPADNEVLAYDTTSSEWVNQTPAEAGLAEATHEHEASAITSGTLDDAIVAESNVTQHQSALSVTESQITDLGAYAENIAELGDVTIASPVDGDALIYDSGGPGWVNGQIAFPPVYIPFYAGPSQSRSAHVFSSTASGYIPDSTTTNRADVDGSNVVYIDKSAFPGTPTIKLYATFANSVTASISFYDLTADALLIDDELATFTSFALPVSYRTYESADLYASMSSGGAYYSLAWDQQLYQAYLIVQWS